VIAHPFHAAPILAVRQDGDRPAPAASASDRLSSTKSHRKGLYLSQNRASGRNLHCRGCRGFAIDRGLHHKPC